ncbi:hypothetical protein MUK42_34217 [Musa troglodytarum]|uniref:Uncharacterized protein n=1 Tax=Musa troglodytarum TaxID=320322 RepID=A0A9E7HR92_9LILI|nr:hypothetical protein MUK42_34217 [Musa troglodytarum]
MPRGQNSALVGQRRGTITLAEERGRRREHERVENVKLWGLITGGWRAEGVNPKPLDSRLGSRIPSAQFATYRTTIKEESYLHLLMQLAQEMVVFEDSNMEDEAIPWNHGTTKEAVGVGTSAEIKFEYNLGSSSSDFVNTDRQSNTTSRGALRKKNKLQALSCVKG